MLIRLLTAILTTAVLISSSARGANPSECQGLDQNIRSGNLSYGAGPNGGCISLGQCQFTLPATAVPHVRADLNAIPSGDLEAEGTEIVRPSADLRLRLAPFGAIFDQLLGPRSRCLMASSPPPATSGTVIPLSNSYVWAWIYREGHRCVTLFRRPSPRPGSATVLSGTSCPTPERVREIAMSMESLWQNHADWLAAIGCRWGIAVAVSPKGEIPSEATLFREIGPPAQASYMQKWTEVVLAASLQTGARLDGRIEPIPFAREDTAIGRVARWLWAAAIRDTFAAPPSAFTSGCARVQQDEADDALAWMASQEALGLPLFRQSLFRAERARP
jgi:hypothetical protein